MTTIPGDEIRLEPVAGGYLAAVWRAGRKIGYLTRKAGK